MADDTAKAPDEERMVPVLVKAYTSSGGQFLAPGIHRMPLYKAKHMQKQGLASPPPKVVTAVAVEEEPKEPEEEFDNE